MTIFLTSSHTLGWAGPLNPANGLIDALRQKLQSPIKCVMISSFPDDKIITDRMAWEIRECFEWADMPFKHYEVLDRRTQRYAKRMISRANMIILCGGHVPTENAFFAKIHLAELLQDFHGVMLTVSAGSMNCATTVYAPPEHQGEAIDPNYSLYMPGLGLTDINILPHYQDLKHCRIDGFRLVKDLVMQHSYQHPVYGLPDGSFFLIDGKNVELRGEAYRIYQGKKKKISKDGERKRMSPGGRFYAIKEPNSHAKR